MNRLLCFLIFSTTTLFTTLNAQIYVDNQGNIYDERQKNTTNTKQQVTVVDKQSSSGFRFDPSKISIGGNFGLQFGNYTTVNISPQVGYDFSKYFTAGMGLGYTYFKDKEWRGNDRYNYSASYVGVNLFARFYPIENIVLSVQPEGNRMWQTIKYRGEKVSENKFIGTLLVGGGFRYQGMLAMIQYDVLQNKNSPYGNNIFYTVGYSFNF